MKEFEKQFNKSFPLPSTIERGPIGRDFKNGCKKMWRAALEQVLEWLDYSAEHKEIADKIHEELEDED